MKYPVAFLGLARFGLSNTIIQDAEVASQVLSRQRRNNEGIFEEMRGANLERECVEEVCSKEELYEAYGDDTAGADQWWSEATQYCSNNEKACHRAGTKTCVNLWRARRCECKEGWENTELADNCSTDIDECAENPCQNGAACTNLAGSYSCSCEAGWTGQNCEIDIDECDSENPCNGGVCTNTDGGYSCECTAAWTGETCQEDVNECSSGLAACENDSKCINLSGDYKCLCTGGWHGKTCAEDLDECSLNLCPAHTVCETDSMNGFVCKCPERGCNNLDPVIFGDLEKSTYGYMSEEVEASGDEGVTEEEVTGNIDVVDDIIVDPSAPPAVTEDITKPSEHAGTEAIQSNEVDVSTQANEVNATSAKSVSANAVDDYDTADNGATESSDVSDDYETDTEATIDDN